MNTIIVIAIAAVAAIAAWAITWFILNNRNAKILGAKDSLLSEKDNQIHQKEMLLLVNLTFKPVGPCVSRPKKWPRSVWKRPEATSTKPLPKSRPARRRSSKQPKTNSLLRMRRFSKRAKRP